MAQADVPLALTNVRFEGNNGHDADETRCLLMTQSGHLAPKHSTAALDRWITRPPELESHCPMGGPRGHTQMSALLWS
jgi:hypothetical protein